MPLFASGVKLLDQLKAPLSGISQKRQGALQTELGRVQGRETASADASGRVRGEYIPQELGRAGQMAGARIDDSLMGVLGGASKKNADSERDYLQNIELAKMIGKLNKPSMLQEILGGLSQGVGSGAQLYGAFGGRGGGRSGPTSYDVNFGNYSGLQPGYMSFADPDLEEYFNGW